MEWKKQKSKEGLNYALLSAAGIITLLAVWQLVVSLGLVNERMLPAPTQIFETLMYKFANKAPDGNVLWVNILASLQVAFIRFPGSHHHRRSPGAGHGLVDLCGPFHPSHL